MIKRFNPDVALYHGWAADAAGNTIIAPYGDDREWGAKAATAGVIVTVEKIVSTDFIREHAHMVKIPAYMVDAVCLAPFGAHPRAMNAAVPRIRILRCRCPLSEDSVRPAKKMKHSISGLKSGHWTARPTKSV